MMPHSSSASQSNRRFGAAPLLVLAGMLAGCETSGGPSNPVAELVAYSSGARASAHAGSPGAARQESARQQPARQEAAKPPETPTTRAQAARICWGMAEKSHASASLETRADIVNKCIDSKLKTADAGSDAKAQAKPAAPKPRQSADAKPAQ